MFKEIKPVKSKQSKPVALDCALCPTYSVYEDEAGCYHIIDGETRIVLSDSFAYDNNDDERMARMEAIVAKLNGA